MIDAIYNEDCLKGMKKIPNGTVDFVLTDLPFGIKQNDWDKKLVAKAYLEKEQRLL